MSNQALKYCEDLLGTMVGFDTVNSNISRVPDPERKLAGYLDEQARSLGFTTQRLPVTGEGFNLLVTHQARDDAPWLLFESHLDTVSVEAMTIDPFAAHIEGGRMYGRGACDTKSSGAAMLAALRQYVAQSKQPNSVAILYSLDEEIYKTGIDHFVKVDLPKLSWKPVGVIVGEPTELAPVVAHNGAVRWTIRTLGVSAHSSDPSRGRSAISMMMKVVQAIESDYVPRVTAKHPLTGTAQCSINVIRGGVQINMIPESCEIEIDRRIVPDEEAHKVLAEVECLLHDLRRRDEKMNVEQGDPFIDPPLNPTGGEAFCAFVQGVLAKMGLVTELQGVAYGTDAGSFSGLIPVIILGPGNIDQAHTCDEWIEIDQVNRAVEVYLNLMQSSHLAPRDELAAL